MGCLYAWMCCVYWIVIFLDDVMDLCSWYYDLVFVTVLVAIHNTIIIYKELTFTGRGSGFLLSTELNLLLFTENAIFV